MGFLLGCSNNHEVISKASPHTIKKFELIEAYILTWAQKLLQNRFCEGIVFIDCMCNSGLYHDENDHLIHGTPIRVSKILRDAAGQYPNKKIFVYLNDNSPEKIEKLKKNLPKEKSNFRYQITVEDCNCLLKRIGKNLEKKKSYHYFLLYDPYDATIDWDALSPFFRSWGEILINHMVSDPIRAIKQVKKESAKEKYEKTYLSDFEDLIPCGSDKVAYEKRVSQIIDSLKGNPDREYYVASFPFFNTQNSLLYDMVHCTSNKAGFKLFKETAWKVFGGKSSTKNTHGEEDQMVFGFDGEISIKTKTDERCYYVKDIADFLHETFLGRKDVAFSEVWGMLDDHPIFPSGGYRNEIKSELKSRYGDTYSRNTFSFSDRR